MRDSIREKLPRRRLRALDRVLTRVAVEQDIEFGNLSDPTAVVLAIKRKCELHGPEIIACFNEAARGFSRACSRSGFSGLCGAGKRGRRPAPTESLNPAPQRRILWLQYGHPQQVPQNYTFGK